MSFEDFETLGFYFAISGLFFFIFMAIKDVLNQGNVPFAGKFAVWLVLFLGCFGFLVKGIIQVFFQS